MKAKRTVVTCSALGIVVSATVLAWASWPNPLPTTEEVVAELMAVDPATLSDEELGPHIEKLGETIRRMPAHGFDALFEKMGDDEAIRDRMRAFRARAQEVEADGEEKLPRLLPPEQRVKMMLGRMQDLVEDLEMLPPEMREEYLEERRQAFGGAGGPGRGRSGRGPGSGGPSKERIMQRRSQSTPTQRAQLHQTRQKLRSLTGGR